MEAFIHPNAKVDPSVQIGPYVVIEDDVVIGPNCIIDAHAVICSGVRMGRGNHVFPGAVIGAIPQDLKFKGEQTTVEIGDYNNFRECVTVHRGTASKGKTVIGKEISLNIQNRIVEKTVNGKQSFNYGGFCLAADTAKTGTYAPGRKIRFARDETGNAVLKMLTPLNGEQLRFCADTDRGTLILTDYAAAGQDGKSLVSVWF